MPAYNLDVYMPVVILMVIAAVMVIGALLVGKLIRPHNPSELKEQATNVVKILLVRPGRILMFAFMLFH